ncbi:MAG: hypothetical protein FJZ92_04045 [Chloroflexi bacterium]|nr:hypothetical protein [Chloroflexota bacterium]
MTAGPSHVVEQVGLAVAELATGRGTLQERLADASLHLLTIRAAEMPDALRDQFTRMEPLWLSGDAGQLDDDAAESAARAIVVVYTELVMLRSAGGA